MSRVLILLSTYNGERYLEEQLESILYQKTQHEIELLVRDDGSSDNTKDILEKWKKNINITLLEDDKRLGPAQSFLELFMYASDADYYAFVDQDDKWDPVKIETATREIGITDEKVLWFSNCRIIDGNGKVIQTTLHSKKPNLNMISQMICGSAQGCAMVFNKSLYDYIKSMNINNYLMHDQLVMEYALVSGKVLYCEKEMFSYRIHDNNVIAQNKQFLIKKIVEKWFGKRFRYKISLFSYELLQNVGDIMEEEIRVYFNELSKCRKSLKSRVYIINNPLTTCSVQSAIRSFKIRTLLGVI